MLIQNLSRVSSIRGSAKSLASKYLSRGTSRSLSTSPWADFEMAPTDPIVGLNEIFQKDDFPSKVIVGVGAYRDDVSSNLSIWCVKNDISMQNLTLFGFFLICSLESHMSFRA